ncbi:MAG TPA: hypothetical protein VMY18_10100, partial [Acidobacteriota bacterium]|nr:hypothetical protein [Acidobacteriota bacterium]
RKLPGRVAGFISPFGRNCREGKNGSFGLPSLAITVDWRLDPLSLPRNEPANSQATQCATELPGS